MITEELLTPYRESLRGPSVRARESAAEWLADHLQNQQMARELRVSVGFWLFDAFRDEKDENVAESILHAIGVASLVDSFPEWPWYILAEGLPGMRVPVLVEYGLETLGESGDPEMIRYLQGYQNDRNELVRTTAEDAIAKLRRIKNVVTLDQMESPETWDRLTASLAVSDLTKPETAWAFLAVQGLVQDRPNDRQSFLELLRREEARGPITGPSMEARIAAGLTISGIATPAGGTADPHAKLADQRLKTIRSWNEEVDVPEWFER